VDELTASVRRRGGASVIDLEGEIGIAAVAELRAAYAEATRRGADTILLNFDGVRYLNSSGIAVIVELLARASAERRTVAAFGLVDHFREVFRIARLSDFMGIYRDEDSALSGQPAGTSKEEG
jgi:anti-sigma B factor antagonist